MFHVIFRIFSEDFSFEKIIGLFPKYEKSKENREIILNMKDTKILKFGRGLKKSRFSDFLDPIIVNAMFRCERM